MWLSIEQALVIVACVLGAGWSSYHIGFQKGSQVSVILYMAIMEEFLKKKMGSQWVLNTLGKDNNRFSRFMETELIEEE
jgi:hypothetical protein